MTEDLQFRVAPKTAANTLLLQTMISTQLGIDVNRIKSLRVIKRSIDARQRNVFVNLTVRAYIDEPEPENAMFTPIDYPDVSGKPTVVVVGAGPAGLFAALELIELGFRPILLERGKDVDRRRKDMAAISRTQKVDSDSNYCFGEGGAGAFSDGKLYTRSKKRGSVEKVLKIFCQFGASTDILVDAHPHIGSDRLPLVIKNMREQIVRSGGEIHFDSRVTDLILDATENADYRILGVKTSDGKQYDGPVILASGHSARDTYRMLLSRGVAMEPKGIAIGVRLEHPQHLIDQIQYHNRDGRGKWLPAAEYSMLTRVDGRGVYSFCMCPGGFVIPSASGPDQQAVNGMSPSNRGTRWANSAMVVEILPEDVTSHDGTLKVMELQEDIESEFYRNSDGTQQAPAQRMTDFVARRRSTTLPEVSYAPGVHSERVDELLPPFISKRLQRAFEEFGRKSKGFLSPEAVVIGCETRTSSPVRLVRDAESLQSVNVEGLFPAGEGAGYAGGIVSAAIDGQRAAQAVASQMGKQIN